MTDQKQTMEYSQKWADWLMRVDAEARGKVSRKPWTVAFKEREVLPEWQWYEHIILERLQQTNVPKNLPSVIYRMLEDENHHDLNRILVKHGYLTAY